MPAIISIIIPFWSSLMLDLIDISETDPIEGKASPLNPRKDKVSIFFSFNFDVACLVTANSSSCLEIPSPSSVTIISVLPPSRTNTDIFFELASILFSTSSFTAEEGRSRTSPAAI